MKQFFFSALFLLSLSFLSVSGNNSKSVTIKEKADSVKIKAIPNALSWINAPKSFKVTKDNAITITAQKGTDIYHSAAGDFNIATAPLLLFKPADNFVFTASVNVDFRNEYDGGSLMIYRNNKYYGKLLFEKNHFGKFQVCSGLTNIVTDDNNHFEVNTKKVFFRIGKSGKLFGFYYSADGKNWKMLRLFALPGSGDFKIGFCAQSPIGAQCTTVFDDIKYVPKAFKDFWTGN